MNLRLIVLFYIYAPIAWSYIGLQSPGCVSKCWENSKLVSPCMTEAKCLCDDVRFRTAFLQCLYSQCQTAQYGLALHHAISTCSRYGSNVVPMLPTLIRHRNRRAPDVENSSKYATSSAARSITARTASISFMRRPRATGTWSSAISSIPRQTASVSFMRRPRTTGTSSLAMSSTPGQPPASPTYADLVQPTAIVSRLD